MFFQIFLFFTISISCFIFIGDLELSTPEYMYIIGISMLGSSMNSAQGISRDKEMYTLTSLLYISSVIFTIWGLFEFDWYLVLISIWVGSYYLYLIRRFVWVFLYKAESDLLDLNWDNVYIVIGSVVALCALLLKI
jgi:hypothetical protein